VLSFFATFDDGTVAAMHGGIGGNIMTIPFLKNTEANFKQYIATYDNPQSIFLIPSIGSVKTSVIFYRPY